MHALVPKITIKGEERVRHFQGVPYADIGTEATVTLAGGTTLRVPVKIISNAVPPGCETIGVYEIEYEALGPDPYGTPLEGERATARRVVEIGSCKLATSSTVIFVVVVSSGLFNRHLREV